VKSAIPRLGTLPQAQRALWPRLSVFRSDFVLYGGTALSLQAGGRISVDFDFFSPRPLELDPLAKRFPILQGAVLRHRAQDTATFAVQSEGETVAFSFFGNLGFGRVSDPIRFSDNGLLAAGLLDLAAQKIKVIQQRAESKDYLDIHLLFSMGVSLEDALGAALALYPEFNPAISLKALSYFGDVPGLPESIQRDLEEAASRVRDIPKIQRRSTSLLPDADSIDRSREAGEAPETGRAIRRSEPELEI
jgi:hypothetical protein